MSNSLDSVTGFESQIYEGDNDRDEWGPGGFVNPVTSNDGKVHYLTNDVDSDEYDRTINTGILVPASAKPMSLNDQYLHPEPNAIANMAADRGGMRWFNLDNTQVYKVAEYAPKRMSLQLYWPIGTNFIVIGNATSLEYFIGRTALPNGGVSGVFPLIPKSGSQPSFIFEWKSKQALYAIGLCAANANLCQLNIIDYSYNGETQIG